MTDEPGSTGAPGTAAASTEGSSPPVTASRAGSSVTWTHPPSRVMPIGITSYRLRSIEASMFRRP